jgi:hypothetical protein
MRVVASFIASFSFVLGATVAMAQPADNKCAALTGLNLPNAE